MNVLRYVDRNNTSPRPNIINTNTTAPRHIMPMNVMSKAQFETPMVPSQPCGYGVSGLGYLPYAYYLPQLSTQQPLHPSPQQISQSPRYDLDLTLANLHSAYGQHTRPSPPNVPIRLLQMSSTNQTSTVSDVTVSDTILYTSEQVPVITYNQESETSPDVLVDIWLGAPEEDDAKANAGFESDASSESELMTPEYGSPPPTPTDFLGEPEELFSLGLSEECEQKKPITKKSKKSIRYIQCPVSAPSPAPTLPSSPKEANSSDQQSVLDHSEALCAVSAGLSATEDFSDATGAERQLVKTIRLDKLTIRTDLETPVTPLTTPDLVSEFGRKRRSLDLSDDENSSDSVNSESKRRCARPTNGMTAQDHKRIREEDNDEIASVSKRRKDEIDDSTSETASEDSSDSEYRPNSNNGGRKTFNSRKIGSLSQRGRGTLGKKKAGKGKTTKGNTGGTVKSRQSGKPTSPKKSSKPTTPTPMIVSPAPSETHTPTNPIDEWEGVPLADPRPTQTPTIFQQLTQSGIDWCRYCGTTEGVNWRPGPWGKRTLCNKHGCDYKGYGFACKLPRLDLTAFMNETVEDRDRPVLQLYCTVCHKQESYFGNVLVRCEGCPHAYHQSCYQNCISDDTVNGTQAWYCERACHDNLRRKKIVVELPRKRLPLMSTPKPQTSASNADNNQNFNQNNSTNTATTASGVLARPRSSRNSSRT